MNLTNIFSILVYPNKNAQPISNPIGAQIPIDQNNKMCGMLNKLFEKSDSECCIPLRFLHNDQGEMQNDVRDILINIIDFTAKTTGQN